MANLIETLRAFVEDYRIPPLLLTPEYRQNLSYSGERLRWLEAHLDEESRRQLKDYLSLSQSADSAYSAALFRCGLSLGLELAFLRQLPE